MHKKMKTTAVHTQAAANHARSTPPHQNGKSTNTASNIPPAQQDCTISVPGPWARGFLVARSEQLPMTRVPRVHLLAWLVLPDDGRPRQGRAGRTSSRYFDNHAVLPFRVLPLRVAWCVVLWCGVLSCGIVLCGAVWCCAVL